MKRKTILCKTCGAEISKNAKRCPHCGEPTPNEVVSQVVSAILLVPLFVIIVLLVIGFYSGWFHLTSLL